MSSNDDELNEYDLSAWEVPPPADDLADVVIARMGATDVGAVVPVEPREPRRVWLIAAVAAGALGLTAGTYALIRSTKHAGPTSGAVVAERARSLSLDSVSADLDPGADVRWTRQGGVLRVEQRAGTAAWRVDADERLVIDAGAMVASVEATGASLRVEVRMNSMDARVIGASAITSAAVAMITVVVYQGHVKVNHADHTVVVQPGSRYEIVPPNQPPTDPLVAGDPTNTAGVAVGTKSIAILGLEVISKGSSAAELQVANDMTNGIRVRARSGVSPYRLVPGSDKELLDLKLLSNCASEAPPCMAMIGADLAADLILYGHFETVGGAYSVTLKLLDVTQRVVLRSGQWSIPIDEASGAKLAEWTKRIYVAISTTPDPVATTGCDEVTCVLNNYAGTCCEKFKKAFDFSAGGIDRAMISDAMLDIKGSITRCGEQHPDATGKVKVKVKVRPAGTVESAVVEQTPSKALGECVAAAITNKAKFEKTKNGGSFSYPFLFSGRTMPVATDCDAIKDKGMESVNRGEHDLALARFEEALRCKPGDSYFTQLSFMASCNGGNSPKAKEYYPKLTPAQQMRFKIMCIRNKVPYEGGTPPPPTCDADALKDKGMENVNMGQHAAALAQFEASLRCEDDPYVTQLAFMAACNGANEAKAKVYFGKLTETQQKRVGTKCGIKFDEPATSSACDADALKDKGMENVNMGQHAAALAQFEASLRCKDDEYVRQLAFMESCNSRNATKAKFYYAKLSKDAQEKFAPICVRNGVSLPGVATACDPDEIKDKGMEYVNQGKHEEALATFEKSLKCKQDPYVLQLAFMSACMGNDSTKAKYYYAKLAPAQQTRFRVMCIRNNVPYQGGSSGSSAGLTTRDPDKGYLQVFSKPEAKIFIDGVDTGLKTPISGTALGLAPGKHKITFLVGDDRFTYPIVIRAGETETMSKDLQ